MKRLRSKHSHYKDGQYSGGGGEFDHTLREQDEENDEDLYPDPTRHPLSDVQSPPGRYGNQAPNGHVDGGGANTSNSPRSHRRNYENSSNSYYNRKPEALSPVPEFAIRSIDGPAHNQWGSAGRRNASDDYPPHGLSGGGGPNTRSMENIPHGSPSTRRRRNYEQTQIGVGGVVTNSRPGYRDGRVPPSQLSSGDMSSTHSRSQEALPLIGHNHLMSSPAHRPHHDVAQSDINVGSYGKPFPRRGSADRPVYHPHLHSAPASQVVLSSSAPQRSWADSTHPPMLGYDPSRTPPGQRRGRHEMPRDTSYSSNLHESSGRYLDDSMEQSGGGLLRSERSSGKGNEPNLNDVVDFLSSDDAGLVSNAASYLQHLAYGDDNMKSKIRTYGAIPALVNQLRRPETRVQMAVLGALRNLSFGRANDENKMEIAGEHGLAEILLALRMSRVAEVRELLTGLLWNLSSCEEMKLRIIKSSTHDIVELTMVPYTGWSLEAAKDPLAKPSFIQWNIELRNITGTLRNISSSGEPSRVCMRASNGLVDTLVWLLRSAVLHKAAADEKAVENAACVLRNLSYRLENEVDPQEGTGDVLDHDWEEEQRKDMDEITQPFSNSSPGCLAFLKRSRGNSRRERGRVHSPMVSRPSYSVDYANPDPSSLPKRTGPVYGMALLWQPDIVYLYLALIEHFSVAIETIEAAAGAIQNLTACNWKWAVYARNMIRTSNGLRLLAELLNNGHDAVVRAAAMALRNLAIDPRNKTSLGPQVIASVIPRLPYGSNHLGMSEETTISLLCCLMEVCTESTTNARLVLETGEGLSFLTRLTWSRQHTQKIIFAAGKLCSILYECKECKSALKKEGWEMSQFQKLVKESSSQFDFEQRVSISRDYQGSRRKKRSKKVSKKSKRPGRQDDEESVMSGMSGVRHEPMSATSSMISGASPMHISHPQPPRSLPPTAEEEQLMDMEEPGYQLIPKEEPGPVIYQSIDDPDLKQTHPVTPSSVPAPRSDTAPHTETAGSTTSGPLSTTGPLSATSQEESEPDPNATYASVDIHKKRASRRQKEKEKKEKEIVKEEPPQEDSWV
ncbi:catenin delta-1-like isoform X2 [Halichondria panicea]